MKLDVRHVAKLAALSLTDEEANKLAGDLERIVAYVAELDALDTSQVEPTAQVIVQRSGWREDEPRAGLSHEDALAQAPKTEHDGFAVPTFVEG